MRFCPLCLRTCVGIWPNVLVMHRRKKEPLKKKKKTTEKAPHDQQTRNRIQTGFPFFVSSLPRLRSACCNERWGTFSNQLTVYLQSSNRSGKTGQPFSFTEWITSVCWRCNTEGAGKETCSQSWGGSIGALQGRMGLCQGACMLASNRVPVVWQLKVDHCYQFCSVQWSYLGKKITI